jgi:hypothetical protein
MTTPFQFLAVPDNAIAGLPDRGLGKFFLRRLQLLQADDVRRGFRREAAPNSGLPPQTVFGAFAKSIPKSPNYYAKIAVFCGGLTNA